MRRLLALLEGLPDGARSMRAKPDDVSWGMTEELLAQILEITSVGVAERALPEPIQVPRPWDDPDVAAHKTARAAGVSPPPDRAPPRRRPGDSTPVAGTSRGLGAATVEMAAWAARNGGVGGNGAELLGFGGEG